MAGWFVRGVMNGIVTTRFPRKPDNEPGVSPGAPAQARMRAGGAFGAPLRRSVNILVVDAGDCGACLNEVRQLNNPFYNMHRLGFFITPTPRNADVLLVVGPGTEAMRHPLLAAWEAMPEPKKVVAVGSCALDGSVFGPSFTCSAGVGGILPVDVEVPGTPPPPLAILQALLMVAGRAAPSALAAGGAS